MTIKYFAGCCVAILFGYFGALIIIYAMANPLGEGKLSTSLSMNDRLDRLEHGQEEIINRLNKLLDQKGSN